MGFVLLYWIGYGTFLLKVDKVTQVTVFCAHKHDETVRIGTVWLTKCIVVNIVLCTLGRLARVCHVCNVIIQY